MAKNKARNFGQLIRERRSAYLRNLAQLIRERRCQLDLTQEEVAQRIKTSTRYVGHLESGKRRPSERVLTRLADVLGLDRELFRLAEPLPSNAGPGILVKPPEQDGDKSAWGQFSEDTGLRKICNISEREMEMLRQVASCLDSGSRKAQAR